MNLRAMLGLGSLLFIGICFFGYCGRVCDPKVSGSCAADELCNLHIDPNSREKIWLCQAR